jgi:nitrogen regulatory protein P-II 1
MKEIKAYVHRTRVADVIAALKATPSWAAAAPGRQHNLSLYVVKGSLVPLDDKERRYSVELGEEVVDEYKLELHCADDQVDEFVKAIVASARTGQANAGWIYVVDLLIAQPIH